MRPRVVICGTFHRDPAGLARIFRELEISSCHVLSPISLEFTATSRAVVRTHAEFDLSVAELEKFHLRAIRDADFIWLHAPGGYVGISGSYELGYANALRKPIFCKIQPEDEMLGAMVHTVVSVFEAIEFMMATE